MKKIASTLFGTLALLAMVIQPTSLNFTTAQTTYARTICSENPTAPECMTPICTRSMGMSCSSEENACGETVQ
jgi:hypothetical protein